MLRLAFGRLRTAGRRFVFTDDDFFAAEVLLRVLDFADFAVFAVFFVRVVFLLRVELPLIRDDLRLTTIYTGP